ncbi:caspase-3-like [Mya arenaria]|uniref:caspase-3-like n=1 Tax=Mya arenaria TaxID=6604 RepID=UPI0022E761E2|nr:caspase-3-like [Mya arenaria]
MDEKARILHTNLKTYIKDEIETGSDQYHAFVESMKGYGVPKGRLANAKSLYDKFVLLENVGKLGVGNYDSLRQMVKSSGLDELLPKINETDNEIKKLRADSGESTGHIARKRQHDHSTGDARLPEAKQSRVDAAEDDPLWTRDSEGRGRYDTRGKKGYLLIVNYSDNRKGSTRDVEILQSFFREVDFEVDEASNLTLRELEQRFTDVKQRLNDTIAKDNLYCFVCAIMGHGNKDGIATADGKMISEETIRKRFTNNYIPNFAGKPKVFLIQACRGTDLQDGEQVEDDDISDVTAKNNDVIEDDIIVTVPNDADTLIAFSSTPGYKSTRMTVSGSWFITTCVEVFRQFYKTDHLEDMLVTVRERVAQKEREHSKKQMPCVWTSLTKRLFFKKTS